MTRLYPIMTRLYHLFFCKCPDDYFSLFHYIQKEYYFTYDTSIISLIFFVIYYCYYCYYDTIICIIFIANYYTNYFIRKVLYQLFVFAPIILIMTIITLLFSLFLSYTIMTIIFVMKYYINYLFSSLLCPLYPL